MASWFYASEGKQQGPFPDGQFRDLIAQGVVRPDTLVWTEGMAGWQKAGEIPGLVGGGAPPMIPAGGPPMMGGGGYGGAAGGSLTADFSAFGLLGRSIVFVIGILLVIPAPWVTVWTPGWIVADPAGAQAPATLGTNAAMASARPATKPSSLLRCMDNSRLCSPRAPHRTRSLARQVTQLAAGPNRGCLRRRSGGRN